MPPPDWPTTWTLNRERILDLRGLQNQRQKERTPGAGPFVFGTGDGGPIEDPKARKAWDTIIETLMKACRDDNADVATGAVIALGKSRDPRARSLLMELVDDGKAHRTVRESSALALGMLGGGSSEVRIFLEKVAKNHDYETRARAFAALGLGFLGDPGAIPGLFRLARGKESSRDVPACALLALGLLGDEIVVPDLSRAMSGPDGRREPDDILRGYAAAALGAIRSRSGLPALAVALLDKNTQVQRQAALSVGPIARADDPRIVQALMNLVAADRDELVKSFAALSLGEIGAPESLNVLLAAYRKGSATLAPHAALALAFFARAHGPAAVRERIVTLLDREFLASGNNHMRGALAIAVGIVGDTKAVPALLDLVASGGAPDLRSHAAMALGLIGAREAAPALRKVLEERSSPDLQREAALALGLIGDRQAVKILLDLVENGSSDYVRGSAAVALGRLADPETAMALCRLVADPKRTDATRAFAAVALGLVVDRGDTPILSRIGDHLNYSMATEAIVEVLTFL
jgi:HEAT repeat protein